MQTRTRAFLSLGTNLGNRLTNLARAVRELAETEGVEVLDVSPVYETAALGPGNAVADSEPPHLNCAVVIDTRLSATALLAETQRIELAMGRGEHARWAPRVIDIDIALFGDERMSTAALTVPHPSMLERAFVLRPLLDLDAGLAITGAGRLDVALQRLDAQRCERHASARALRVAAAAGGLVAHGITVVGAGRLGTALTGALRAAGVPVDGPFGRGTAAGGARIVLLCVPDHAIAAAASAIAPGRMVGHCSGAATLDALTPHESFSMHPLMTVTRDRPVDFRGAGCAVAGSTPAARATAESIGRILGMRPVEIADADRALYHAAATMASNYLVTLETVAAALAEQVGVSREMLAPLVRASATNWGANGGAALTGPIVRGDAATVARQRAAIEARDPRILALWDALVQHTSALATGRRDE